MVTVYELQTIHNDVCKNARKLVEERGKEYAPSMDTLATFNKASWLLDGHPETLCVDLMAVKLARIHEQVKQKKTPIDSILDLINYAVYLVAIMEELYNEKISTQSG